MFKTKIRNKNINGALFIYICRLVYTKLVSCDSDGSFKKRKLLENSLRVYQHRNLVFRLRIASYYSISYIVQLSVQIRINHCFGERAGVQECTIIFFNNDQHTIFCILYNSLLNIWQSVIN